MSPKAYRAADRTRCRVLGDWHLKLNGQQQAAICATYIAFQRWLHGANLRFSGARHIVARSGSRARGDPRQESSSPVRVRWRRFLSECARRCGRLCAQVHVGRLEGRGRPAHSAKLPSTASVPGFAAGTALWVVALLLISIPRHFRYLSLVRTVECDPLRDRHCENFLPSRCPAPVPRDDGADGTSTGSRKWPGQARP
jgi:hypothetical protein